MFKVGDKVRIREDTKNAEGLLWLEEMNKFRGIETYIKDINGCWYHLEKGSYEGLDIYAYAESWLELMDDNNFEVEEKEIEKLFI